MDAMKLLSWFVLVVLGLWAVLTAVTLGGVGVDSQLPGSDWQAPALVTALVVLAGLVAVAAVGRPWRRTGTAYW